jgi:hypothetical protein
MGEQPSQVAGKQLSWTALGLGVASVVVGVPAYCASTFWIQCPPSYGFPPGVKSCNEVEDVSTLVGLVVMLAGLTAFIGAAIGVAALLRRERLWPALVPIAIVAALLVNWIIRMPR